MDLWFRQNVEKDESPCQKLFTLSYKDFQGETGNFSEGVQDSFWSYFHFPKVIRT